MDRSKKYRQILKSVTEEHANMSSPIDTVVSTAVADFARNNYFLIDFDSRDKKHYIVFHLRLEDGKIFVVQDGIEYGIEQDLIEAGISRENIILPFQSAAEKRENQLIAA